MILHCLSSVLKSVSGTVAADRPVSFGTYKQKWLQYRRAVGDGEGSGAAL